jgi:peptide/nickel transport system permease protein
MFKSQLTVGLVILLVLVALSVGAPLVTPFEPARINLPARLKPPLFESNAQVSWFGTDQLGRDLFTRTLYAGRASLVIGLIASSLSAIVGSLSGMLAGYFEGRLGGLVMRVTEIQQAFPFLVFAIAIVGVVGAGLVPLILALALGGWYFYARIAFAETRSIKHQEFIESAYAVGATNAHILRRHLLPNILPPLIVVYSFNVASAIIAESSLSFLGLGVPPSVPSWGSMISDGRGFIETAWWLSTMPGIFLLAAVLAANLLGDGLRESLDPRTRRRKSMKG